MPDIFRTRIRSSLANPNLQAALDANAERRIQARQQAFASLGEDLETLRRRAHAIRSETIRHLDRYLAQFVERAESNGIIVYPAANAAEAVNIVLEIARQKGARLVAKSKTMVGEEIVLNPALEAAGMQVVETDLGEFIVQLRGEPPAHIITPAVHLRRSDVGRTFEEKLGLPYTEDIPTMTAAARRTLRSTFLNADIGISGVNFGVAESGSLCLLTNEGNGRMVTTLPPVHIALMGIERLAPTLDDLAVLLSLLPRSATGQKLTVYASLIHGPRRPDDFDGPVERHLILVDNGRRALRGSPLEEALLCIRCGACMNACPVFRELGGHAYVSRQGVNSPYPGPIGSVLSPALFGQAEYAHLARASSLCGACKEACPVDIDLPTLLLRVRSGGMQLENRRTPQNVPAYLKWGLRLFAWAATSPWRFAAAQRLVGISSRALAPFSGWLRLPAFTGWGYSKDFPRPAARPFRSRWASMPSVTPAPIPSPAPVTSELSPIPEPAPSSPDHPSRFAEEMAASGGQVSFCTSQELAGQVLELLRTGGIHSLQAWEADRLPEGLLEALEQSGLHVIHSPNPDLRAGLTGALAAVAETGTLVLPGGPGCPLTASLLPEIHFVVLHAEDIYENLPQVFALPEVRNAPAVALISGPSRTADIEMTLTIGVHGPGEVHVFIVGAKSQSSGEGEQ